MALSPLQIELIDDTGAPVNGATVELRHELTGATADGYNRDGSTMAPPFLTDATGAKLIWLVNGIYEWRTSGAFTSEWKAFRAWGGYGVEGLFTSSPAVSLDDPMPASFTTLDTITVPSFGVENAVGEVAVVIDFAFNHMYDLHLALFSPLGTQADLWQGDALGSSTNDYAFDGEVRFASSGLDRYPGPMVGGGVYQASLLGPVDGQLYNEDPEGGWTLRWRKIGDVFTPRTGVVRSWQLEFVPT